MRFVNERLPVGAELVKVHEAQIDLSVKASGERHAHGLASGHQAGCHAVCCPITLFSMGCLRPLCCGPPFLLL